MGLQSFAALFFLADILADLSGSQVAGSRHYQIEFVAVVALVLGIVFISLEIRKVFRRHQHMAAQLMAASGAFAEILEAHFDDWSLTRSERDVAVLAIKGLSITEIAQIRQTKEGTVKAQCNAIYRKAGVSGRPQLLSLFIEELMGDGLIEPRQMAR